MMKGVALDEDLQARKVKELSVAVGRSLEDLVPQTHPAQLYEPVRYVLSNTGKRLRPVLLLLTAEAFGVETHRAMPAALAVEVFHNFTLVHDDIMDHADERRGRPTVHRQWDQDTAILCGDYLMGLSYELLSQSPAQHLGPLLRAFSEMVRRLCEGQTLDKAFEKDHDVTVSDYLGMIDLKTGALLQMVFEMGGILAGKDDASLQALGQIGHLVGRAFQIQDDLLDLTAQDASWGKPVGGDLMEGKKTYLLLKALERATGSEKDWFTRILHQKGLSAEAVPEARQRMERLGILEETAQAVATYTDDALTLLQAWPKHLATDTVVGLIHKMQARKY